MAYSADQILNQFNRLIWKNIYHFNWNSAVVDNDDLYQAVALEITRIAHRLDEQDHIGQLGPYLKTIIWRTIMKEITRSQWGGRYYNTTGVQPKDSPYRVDGEKRREDRQIHAIGEWDVIDDRDYFASVESAIDTRLLKDRISEEFGGTKQELILYGIIDGKTPAEIANDLGVSRTTIYTQMMSIDSTGRLAKILSR